MKSKIPVKHAKKNFTLNDVIHMKLKDSLEILRPVNCIMGSLTVIIGILNTRSGVILEQFILNIILGIIVYFFLAGSGMIINDIYDVEIDRINRPERPIPSGRITIYQAKELFVLTFLIGMFFTIINSIIYSIGILNVLLAGIFGLTGWVYAKWGKKSGFPGNIIVSISFSIGLIYGAVLNNQGIPSYIYYYFLTSFFLLISREIIKGCEDIEGDKKEGVKTLAIKIGVIRATIIAIITQVCAMIFFILPVFTAIINPLLFLITMIPGLLVVGYSLVLSIQKPKNKEEFGKISLMLKIGALLGLIAFIFASL